MALLKFIGGITLSAALVKCGITLVVALLDLTAGVILTAKKWQEEHGRPIQTVGALVHCTGAPTVRMGLPCSYSHFLLLA